MQSDTPSGDAPAGNRFDPSHDPAVPRVRGLAPHEIHSNLAARPGSAPDDLAPEGSEAEGSEAENSAPDTDPDRATSDRATSDGDTAADHIEPGSQAALTAESSSGIAAEYPADRESPVPDLVAARSIDEPPPDPAVSEVSPDEPAVSEVSPDEPASDPALLDGPVEPEVSPAGPTVQDRPAVPGSRTASPTDAAMAAHSPSATGPGDSEPRENGPGDAEDAGEDDAAEVDPPQGRPRLPLPRVLAVANQKGGVGKTTTTVNVAACLAELGHRTLLVDLDPQANATTGLGLDPRALTHSVYHVMLHNVAADSCIEPTEVKNLFILPSSLDLAGAEIELVPALSREHRLRVAIESVIDDYDYVLIDCPPSLGLLTINALTAAKEILVPIQCEYYALEGLGQLLHNVELVTTNLNPTLQISHIVLVMFDSRTKLAGQVVDEVREHFGDIVCTNVIPRTVRLSEAPSFGQPITTFDTTSTGAEAYRAVTKEVIGDQT